MRTWVVQFRSNSDGPPAELRLRRLLKLALRSFGLRAVSVEEMPVQSIDAPESTGHVVAAKLGGDHELKQTTGNVRQEKP